MNKYTIRVDGVGYAGESDEEIQAVPPTFRNGWSGKGPATASGIAWGEPKVIQGQRCLQSALRLIMDRLWDVEYAKIVIEKVEP